MIVILQYEYKYNGYNLSDYQSSIVNNLSILIEIRSGNNFVYGWFTLDEINQMIKIIATK